jgi:hypothetical protein
METFQFPPISAIRCSPDLVARQASAEACWLAKVLSPAASEQGSGEPATGDGREPRVRLLAYLKAQRRGFTPGREVDDWLEAEREVDAATEAEGRTRGLGLAGRCQEAPSADKTAGDFRGATDGAPGRIVMLLGR